MLIIVAVTDLTFHEMAFLKQPRREPQKKSLSRRRESEKGRDEREREEISAFFLRKNLPDRYDAQGKKQPPVSGLSSLDGRTGVTSNNNFGHNPGAKRTPESTRAESVARARDKQQRVYREGSRTSTYMTWSTSHRSPGLEYNSPNGVEEDTERGNSEHGRSSTPMHVREAFARSGIFNNTGISYLPVSRQEGEGPGINFKDGFIGAESPSVEDAPAQVCGAFPSEPARIVRYQDRGTMAVGETGCLDGQAHHTKTNTAREQPTEDKDGASRAVEQDTTDIAASMTHVSVSASGLEQPTDSGVRGSLICNSDAFDNGKSPNEGGNGLQTGPDRPRPPKLAVIERLEAAAEDVRLRSPSDSTPVAQIAQEHTQPSGNHNLHHTLPPTPLRFSHYHAVGPMCDANWLPPRAFLMPRRNLGALSAPSTLSAPWRPMVSSPRSSLVKNPSPRGTRSDPFITGRVVQSTNPFPLEYLPSSTESLVDSTQDLVGQQSQHQSMQDYIAQIEQEVLGRCSEYDQSRQFPVTETDHVREPKFTGLGGDNESKSAYQPYNGMNGTLLDRAPSNMSQHHREHVQYLDEDEEQRFMSSFWRTNQYHI